MNKIISIFQTPTGEKRGYALLLLAGVGVLSTLYHQFPSFIVTYSDIRPFYYIATAPGIPYVDKVVEYPVLTGLFIHFAGFVGRTYDGYYFFSAFCLILFTAITTYFLYDTIHNIRVKTDISTYWIFAPSMLFFLVYNWDAMAIMFVVIALHFMSKDKDCIASLFLALGFCSKFFPAIYLLPLLIKRRGLREWIEIIGIFCGVALVINVPFMIANFDGWYYFFAFNSQRLPNPDSIWALIQSIVPSLTTDKINIISFLLFSGSSLFAMWKFRNVSTIKLFLIITLLFMIFNKVFSPQYLLWLLPLYVLLPMKNRGLFYGLELSNLIVLFAILVYYFGQVNFGLGVSTFFVVIRHILLIYLLLSVLGWPSGSFIKRRGRLSFAG